MPKPHQIALIPLLMIVAVLSLHSPFIVADQETNGTINISASGSAVEIGKNKGQATASLILTGTVAAKDNGKLKINALTGNLQIGSTNYFIADGHGESNKNGEIEINARASDGNRNLELKLHGTMQSGSVIFDSNESKLSSLYFLFLIGQATITLNTGTGSTSNGGTSTSTSETSLSSTETSEAPAAQITTTETVTQTVTASTTLFNQTTTETQIRFQNVTMTITQPGNQTITETVTTTIANSTITQTVTATVANITLTTMITVTNSTSTITNSTSTGT